MDGLYTDLPRMVPAKRYWSELGTKRRIPRAKRLQWYRKRGLPVASTRVNTPHTLPAPPTDQPQYIVCDGAPIDLEIVRTADNMVRVQSHFIVPTCRVVVVLTFKGEQMVCDKSGTATTSRELVSLEFQSAPDCSFDLLRHTDSTKMCNLFKDVPGGSPLWALKVTPEYITPLTYKPYDGWNCSSCPASFRTVEELCVHMNVPRTAISLCVVSRETWKCETAVLTPPVGARPLPSRWQYAINGDILRSKLQRVKSTQDAANRSHRRMYGHQHQRFQMGPVY